MQFKDLKVGDDFLSAAGLNYKKTGENISSYGGENGYKFGNNELVDKIRWSTKNCPSLGSHYKSIKSNNCSCGATFEIV